MLDKKLPTRRSFMRGTAALGLSAMAASQTAGGAFAATPNRGGTLRVAKGDGATTDTLDPATYTGSFMVATSYGVHGFLTGIRPDGEIEPQLAETWEASPDAKNWRFTLRRGVTFHDGKPLTAEDVVATIRYHTMEGSKSAVKTLLEGIEKVEADNDVVEFTLSTGNADFPFTFTDYHMPILPSVDGEVDWKSGNGCGPYKLVKLEPGISAKFARNHDDWDQNRGWFEEVELLSVADPNARTSALVSGEVHATDKIDLKTAGRMGQKPGLTVHSVEGSQHYVFAMSTNTAPFDDPNIRLALKYAIDRQELVDKILFGYGTVGNDHPVGRSQRFFNTDLEQTVYDPERAKFHLKKAGLDSVSVELTAADAGFPGSVDAATLYQASAAKCGVEIDVTRAANDGYWSDVWMKKPFSAAWWAGRPVEDAMLTTVYASGAAWNDTFWENERFNELLISARSELDEPKRRDMYFEMQTILNGDGGAVIPVFANFVFATDSKVRTGERLSAHFNMDGERWMERWSFA